ncbi:MAG TPA: metallophosphoesterase [Thermoanaerobaculia bacterium]|nr:metallophosphoesterase [Thermoanaerobaculia bacterium]
MPVLRRLSCPAAALGALAALVCGLLLQACASGGARTASPVPPQGHGGGTFVVLSDFHFDPFYDPALVSDLVRADAADWRRLFERSTVASLGAYGADTPYPLLASTLKAAAEEAPDPDFVLLTGDFLAHGFSEKFAQQVPGAGSGAYPQFVAKTMAFVTAMIRGAFPRAPIVPALGNNDSDCGDYELQPGGPFLSGLAKLWKPLLGRVSGSFEQTFPSGGFYSMPHPTVPKLALVVLNTDFFSSSYQDTCAKGVNLAAEELTWLERTLETASRSGQRVWLMYHIPPGIDTYATLQKGSCPVTPVSLWSTDDLTRFRQILARFPGLVKVSFAAHTHRDEFRLPPGGGYVHVAPAVSPVYYDNPAFAVFSYARASGDVADFKTYELDLDPKRGGGTKWTLEYDFQQAYGRPAVDASTLREVLRGIHDDPAVRERYLTLYPVSAGQPDLPHWLAYWCAARVFTPEEFTACYCAGATSP